MSTFTVTADGRVLASFDEAETNILLSLSRQFSELLAAAEQPSAALDPALARLFPDAYRDDPDASAEFSGYTRTDIASVKSSAATLVHDGLARAIPHDGEDAVGDDRLDGGILLDSGASWSWLRHLADLRLTIAARLGVVDDPHAFDEDPDPQSLSEDDLLARSVFDWLGYVQELLIAALEDAASAGSGTATGPTGPSSARG